MDSGGKQLDVKPGIWPSTDGPNMIPATTSAITLGC